MEEPHYRARTPLVRLEWSEKKHVGVLARAGLVISEKVGRVRTCQIGPRQLEDEMAWLKRYRQLWDARFDELDKVVEDLKRKDPVDGRKKRK